MPLRLEEFSDQELLFALEECGGADGATSLELAEHLEPDRRDGLKHPHQNIAIRLGWLKRYGVVERDDKTRRWVLSPLGEGLMHGRLKASERRMLEEIDEGRLLTFVQAMTGHIIGASREAAKMSERQLRYGVAQHKQRWR